MILKVSCDGCGKVLTVDQSLLSSDIILVSDLMAAENERLKAIIDLYPVTEDGVPMVPVMDVWLNGQLTYGNTATVICHAAKRTLTVVVSPGAEFTGQIYSTREAAESAKEMGGVLEADPPIVPEDPFEACYECPHRLEMEKESRPATLDWVPTGNGLDAESRHEGTTAYHLYFIRLGVWAVCLGVAEIFRGNPADCIDACEELERNPDSPPLKTKQ